MTIPSDLIDIDFSVDPRAKTLTRETHYGEVFHSFASAGLSVIPRSQWPELCDKTAEFPLEKNVQRIMNQGQEGSCFPAGTMVRMANKKLKPIEDICVNDDVVSAEGNISTVTQCMRRQASSLVRITTRNGRELIATPDHPILTLDGYKRAGQLNRGRTLLCGGIGEQDTILSKRDASDPDVVTTVYNLEVEADHSYIANGIGVHNCASNASAQCMETMMFVQGGKDLYVPLSAISLYKQVASSSGSGSTIDGNLRALQQTGILPLDTPANRTRFNHVMSHTGFSQRYPDGWQNTAKLFRADEWYDLSSFDEVATCAFYGFPICYGRAGHAICGVRIVRQSNGYYLRYANSWGDWGENGYGYDSEGAIASAIRSYGAWGLRSTIIPDIGVPNV